MENTGERLVILVFRSADNLHRVDLKSNTKPLTIFIPGPFGLRKSSRATYNHDFESQK